MENIFIILLALIVVYLYINARKKRRNQRTLKEGEASRFFEIKDKNSIVKPKEILEVKEKTKNNRFVDWDNIPDEFVIFDLETTGFKTNKKPVDIIELSAIKIKKDEYLLHGSYEVFSSLVFPHRGGLNEDAMKINMITEKMLSNEARHMRDVLPEFISFVGKRLLVAHNVDFDRWFLQREISDQGISKRFKYECTLILAREAFPFLGNHKLTSLADYLGIDKKGAHRSLRDCEMTLELYLAVRSALPKERFQIKKKTTLQTNLIEKYVGKNITFTGVLEKYEREEAQLIAEKRGFIVKASVSKKIDFVVVGKNPGARLEKANELGLKIIGEDEFTSMINAD